MRLYHSAILALVLGGYCLTSGAPFTVQTAPATRAASSTGPYSVYLVAGTDNGAIVRTRSGTQWRVRYGPSGGDITALAAALNCCTIYAASAVDGVWRSDDGGAHWSKASDGLSADAQVHALAVDPTDGMTAYAGADDGLYTTTDGGASWQQVSSNLPTTGILSVAVDSGDPTTLWVGTADAGLYRSTDGGSTWAAMNNGDLSATDAVQTIALNPADSTLVYAGTSSGLYQSTVDDNGNVSWIALGNGFPADTEVDAVAVSPREPGRVYAGTAAGVYVSTDGGSSWTQSADLADEPIHALVADLDKAAVAYAATDQGISRSDDGGGTWDDMSGDDLPAGTDVMSVAMARAAKTPADSTGPACCGARYFAHTGHNMSGAFLAFYQHYGGLGIFGYPRTEAFTEGGIRVQYTDRFLLQLVNGQVQTARLGRLFTSGRTGAAFKPQTVCTATGAVLVAGHCLAGRFLRFWRDHRAVLGAPISEVLVEGNGDGTGRHYRLQWFEKGRLEYHPELAGTRYAMEGGVLGVQLLQQRGWLP